MWGLCCTVHFYFAGVIDTVTSPEYSTPQPFAGRPGSREQSRKKRVGRPRTPGGESISAHYSCSSADIIVNYGEWWHSSCSFQDLVSFPDPEHAHSGSGNVIIQDCVGTAVRVFYSNLDLGGRAVIPSKSCITQFSMSGIKFS